MTYGLFRFFRSERIGSSWKVLACVALIGCGVWFAFGLRDIEKKLEEQGRKDMENQLRDAGIIDNNLELKTYEVTFADNKIKFEVYDIQCNLMPDNAVNIVVSAYVTNTSNETFDSDRVWIFKNGDETQKKYDHKYGEYYNVSANKFMYERNVFAQLLPHRDDGCSFSFYVMPGVYDIVVNRTIIGKIDTEKYTKEQKRLETIPNRVDLNDIFDTDGTIDWNTFGLDESQLEYLKQEGIYYDKKNECWRRK